MTLQEIKNAVRAGKTVHWANDLYRVIPSGNDKFLVICDANQSCVGLTHQDGITMNEHEDKFFIAS